MTSRCGLLRIPTFLVMIIALLAAVPPGGAQSDRAMRGYGDAQTKEQRGWEEKMRAIPDPESLRRHMAFLASGPHHVGSSKDKENAGWILDKFKSWGLPASIEEYRILFPTPRERRVELLAPEKFVARLQEPAVIEDPDSTDADQLPTYNAYSADGDVTAQVVYVNYGVPADYEALKKLGVDVRGKIALARYGSSWRGIKPKVAFENGAIGCLIYSDPRDDGYYQGDVYPEGPYRPEQGVQRGSVMDMPIHPGDPLTPGVGATSAAKRLDLKDAGTLTKIPVMPISWGDALPILRNLRGALAPESWRGALPITYHIGPGPAVVHFKMASNWDLHTIYNVIARIEGSTFPDEWIVVGNHHDAWVNGASDPVSGMAAVLEQARAFGELLKLGWKPKRTIILAAWDGEEEGLLGSTEWVEQHAAELRDKAVAYINGDSNGKGWLGAGGSHTLERFIDEVERDIVDPQTGKSIQDVLKRHMEERAKDEKERQEIRARPVLRIGALGSGSDYTAFIDHLGIASLNLGFGSDGGGGVYHSIYDSIYWYTHFSDTTFAYGRALAQLQGSTVMRLADAPVLPFEFTGLAETIGRYADELDKLAVPENKVELAPLKAAQKSLAASALAYETAFSKAFAAGSLPDGGPVRLREINRLLFQSERVLTDPDGLPRRPWFKHQLYAPGFYTGYGVKTIPYVREALEQRQWDEAARGVEVVCRRLAGLAVQIDSAARLLR